LASNVSLEEALGVNSPAASGPSPEIVMHPAALDARPAVASRATTSPYPQKSIRAQLPPVDILMKPETLAKTESEVDLKERAAILIHTLREFSIQAQIDRIEKGPVITRFELRPAPGIKVERIAALSNNIALNLQAPHVRILAPIPGRAAVGIEVPNIHIETVRLRDLLESLAWKKRKARLPLAIGKDVAGRPITADLAEMPHLLIAGATGAGKTVCVNSLIVGLLFALGPDRVRFLMVDPKIVEMQIYNRLPHMIAPVITDPKKVVNGLAWAIREMERRYRLLAEVGQRHIVGYNQIDSAKRIMANERLKKKHLDQGLDEEDFEPLPECLPYIVIVIDELADLMLAAQADIENQIARLAQLSRAVGIHLIIATQRPSVNVITGTIKANFPGRIAFQVASKVDSRTILDGNGAETLLGKGDMLFLPPGKSKPIRVQATLVEDEEIEAVVEYLENMVDTTPGFPSFDHVDLSKNPDEEEQSLIEEDDDWDPLLEDAYNVIADANRASTSYLQRRLKIGYNRAARIMEQLEKLSIVGPANGSGPREILVDVGSFRFRRP
jgi:S-DNA-T family DNA segregation ATPase FtsK/SpoIIIE